MLEAVQTHAFFPPGQQRQLERRIGRNRFRPRKGQEFTGKPKRNGHENSFRRAPQPLLQQLLAGPDKKKQHIIRKKMAPKNKRKNINVFRFPRPLKVKTTGTKTYLGLMKVKLLNSWINLSAFQVSCTVAMATRLLLLWLGKEMFHPWQFGARSNQFFVPKVLKNTTSNSANVTFFLKGI